MDGDGDVALPLALAVLFYLLLGLGIAAANELYALCFGRGDSVLGVLDRQILYLSVQQPEYFQVRVGLLDQQLAGFRVVILASLKAADGLYQALAGIEVVA